MEPQRQKGFTLVEMAIVLVIIGIILAAVMKGRDLVHSAHETEAMQGYFLKWTTMANDYFKATGWPLHDGARNGGFPVTPGDPAINPPNAWMDAGYLQSVVGAPGSVGGFGQAFSYRRVAQALNQAGINPCFVVKSSAWDLDFAQAALSCADNMNPYQTYVDDEYAGKRIKVHVAFGNFLLDNWENFDISMRKNVLVFYNMPYDYAKRFDTQVDGRTGGRMGRVINMTEGDQALAGTPLPALTTRVANDPPAPGDTGIDVQEWPMEGGLGGAQNRSSLYIVGYVLDYDVH